MGAAGDLPLAARLLLVAALVVLGAVVVIASSSLLGRGATSLGGTFGELIGGLLPAAPTASPTPPPATAPQLDVPRNAYTNQATYALTGLLPGGVRGTPGALIRVYDNGALVGSIPVPDTTNFIVPTVPLTEGSNELTVAVVTAAGEGKPSDPIQVIRDDQPPKIALTSPKNGLRVTTATVHVAGTTQAGSSVTILNDNTGAGTTVLAGSDGSFGIDVILGVGPNDLTVSVTDPAGNTARTVVTVTRASGGLQAKLQLSPTSMPAAATTPLTMTVTVTDGSGQPINTGTATFTMAPPNQGAVVSSPIPIAGGQASWSQTPASGQSSGSGLVTVQVQLPDGRTANLSATFSLR